MLMNQNDVLRSFSQFIKEGDPFGIYFIGKTVCDEKFYIERKNSNIMALEYIVQGEGTLKINGQELNPSEGDVFLLTEGSSHKYYPEKNNPWRKYFVSFTGPLAKSIRELYIPYNSYLFKNCDVRENFEKIFNVAFDDLLSYEEVCEVVLLEIIKIVLKIHSTRTLEGEHLADIIKRKIDYSLEGEFSLDEIANSLSYSKNHIINVFKEKFGMTPYKYYMQSKIDVAKRYLRQTSCSVSDISANLAFSDPQYFSSYFKRITGYSPREYRNKYR